MSSEQNDWNLERAALMMKLQQADIGSPQSRALARAIAELDQKFLGKKPCGCELNVILANLPTSEPVVLCVKGAICSIFHDFTDAERQACIERFVRGHKQPDPSETRNR